MSSSQEQDYILGLPAPCPGLASDEKLERSLKGTELRLGLPGSESPERKIGSGSFSLFGKELRDERRSDGFSCGEMGFFYDMNASSKWVSSVDAQEDGDFAGIGNETFLPSKGCSSSSNLGNCFAGNTHIPEHGKDETEADTFPPASRERVVGWPPIRSFRKPTSSHQSNKSKISPVSASSNHFIKVSMDGAPYLRKIDLKTFSSYAELSAALQGMFSFFTLGPNDQSLGGLEGDNSSGTEYVLTYEDKDGDWMLVGDVPWEMFMTSCNRLRIVNRSEAIGLGELMHFKVKMVCDQEPN